MKKLKLSLTDKISTEDFCNLREKVGFQKLTLEQAQKVLSHTTYTVAASCDGMCVGVTRLLFDYGTDAYITDVIVHPDYQGYGIGGLLIQDVLCFIKDNAVGTRVTCSLYANIGKEEFYDRFGFSKLPNEKYGYGMLLEL